MLRHHSPGKTTLLKWLEKEIRAHGLSVARTHGSLDSEAARKGFPNMHQPTATTTQWLIAAGICAHLEATLTTNVVLVHPIAFGPLAYSLAGLQQRHERLDNSDRDRLTALVAGHSVGYTLLLTIVLDPIVPLGKHRDRALNFHASVEPRSRSTAGRGPPGWVTRFAAHPGGAMDQHDGGLHSARRRRPTYRRRCHGEAQRGGERCGRNGEQHTA